MPVRSMQILLFLISSIILTEAVKPPGYVKPPETPDENPPKYEYGYNIEDEKGAAQGKSEQRDGIYALGGYYVQGSDSKQNVQYFADDWGYHPYVEYSNKGPHSSARAQLAIGAEAIKLKNNEIPAKDQVAENINRQQKAPVLQPQVLQPQVVQPQVLQPQVLQPQVVQPQVLQPQVVQPQVLQPQVLQPQVLQHQVLQPQLQQPELQQAQVQQPVLLQNEVLPAAQQPQQILIPQQHTQQFVLQPQEQQQILLPELLPTPQQLISQNQGHLSEQLHQQPQLLQQQPQLLQQQPQLLQQQPQLLLQPTGAEQTQQVIIQHNQQEQQQEQQQQQLQQQQLQQQVILTQEQQQPQQIIYEQPQQLLINQQVDNSVQEKNVQISQQIIHENVNNQFELEQLTAGNYGNKIITNAPKLIEPTKNLVSGQDVININEAYSQKQDASLETSTIKSIVSEYTPTISTVLSNVQINHDGDSSTPAPVTELSLDKEPIIVPDYEDNQIKSTTIRTEEVYSTTGATLQTQQYEATAAPDVIVTPRPLGASFLAPITAGVQLQNVEQKTVNINTSPQHFLVEVQKSVPFYLGKYEYIHNPEVYTEQQISINQTVSAEQKAVENINLGNTLLYFPVEQKPKAEALVQELPQVQINQQFHQAELNVQQPPSTIIEHNFLNKVEQTESESKAVAVETEQRQILHSDIQAEAEIATQEKQTLQHHIQQTVPLVQVVEKPVPYPVVQTKFVEKPIEITKFVNQPYPVEVPVHIPVHVPYPVEKKVPYPVQVEKIVEKPVHITKIVEKPIHIPQPYPVQKIVEKPVEVLKYVDRPYPVHVRVPQPYPVEKLVKIPIQVPVEKIVEKPVPVPQYIEKIVEKPVTKYIDRPYPVQVPVQVQPLQYGQKQILQVNQGYQLPYLQNLHQILLDTRYQQQVPFKYTKTVQQLGNREQYSQQSQQQQQAVLFANPYLYAPTHIKQYLPPKQEINVGKGFAQQQLINGYLPPKPDCEQQSVALRNLYFTIKPDDYIGLLPPKQGSRHVKYARKLRTPRSNLKNLRLEYGFMPPLVPSLEIDENGHPIEKDEKN